MVNADALQLYRGLDIGTAKLTVPERRGVPHHLLDVLEPEAPFGESNGYVALEAFNMPMRVTAITHKRNPVFTSIISQVTPFGVIGVFRRSFVR